ncbi:hypothetical protein [uncultured Sulfitobacter sp.]|uniref:hypothetical protein n=1 Tax=uncultured Sulfitobacter sp. TaxID=191468 RepID=UPI002634272F|nr:hypothetical protein [uncultured Sulfitobacter sp.]
MTFDQLTVRFPDATTHVFDPSTGKQAAIHIADDTTVNALCLSQPLEGYMNQSITLPFDDRRNVEAVLPQPYDRNIA